MEYHNPVLLTESIDRLEVKADGVYVDVTFGGGGHSKEILNRLGKNGKLFAFDQDIDAKQNEIDDDRFVLIIENFTEMSRYLGWYGIKKVDGIIADLGVSSHQFDIAERGFATRFDGPLDMRMNRNKTVLAKQIINGYEEKKLSDILFKYGELRNARSIAKAIVMERKQREISTSFQLREVLRPVLPKIRENKLLAQVFQAIRIELNQELEALKSFLTQVPSFLNSGGRLVVISYHSLEDRLVKRFINTGGFDTEAKKDLFGNSLLPLKKIGKLIIPSDGEVQKNNRARSAKLRVATLNKKNV